MSLAFVSQYIGEQRSVGFLGRVLVHSVFRFQFVQEVG